MSSRASSTAIQPRGVRLQAGAAHAARHRAAAEESLTGGEAGRAALALALANARYWGGVAPLVRQQMRHWRARAQLIADPQVRALALGKLGDEGVNAEVAAILATQAARARRRPVVKAIVALEVLYDYLDGLTELPARSEGERALLYRAFVDALAPGMERTADYHRLSACHDGGYLQELVATVRFALGGLPSTRAVAEELHVAAVRGAEAQLALHSIGAGDVARLRRWAMRNSLGSRLQWREYLAGAACSVLSAHALIVSAAAPGMTGEHARALDELYLSIAVLPTLLDSAIDREHDVSAGRASCASLYEDGSELAESVRAVVADALELTRRFRRGERHLMMLAGVAAYYMSAPTVHGAFARPALDVLRAQLSPLIAPTLAAVRALRAAAGSTSACEQLADGRA